MGSIRQILQAQHKTIKKLSRHKINQSKQKNSQIIVCLVHNSKVKRSQKFVSGLPDGVCQNPKKHQSTNQDEHFYKKSMFSILKEKRSQKFVWELRDGICRLDLKS
jgi:hypothetical protein